MVAFQPLVDYDEGWLRLGRHMLIFRIARIWSLSAVLACTLTQATGAGILDILPSWPVIDVGEPIPDELIQLWSGGGPKGADGQPPIGKWCAGIAGLFVIMMRRPPRDPPDPNKNGED